MAIRFFLNSMESYAMNQPPKFLISFFGFTISGEGALGIIVAAMLAIALFGFAWTIGPSKFMILGKEKFSDWGAYAYLA